MLKQQRSQGIASEEKEVEVAREKKNIELAQTKADAYKEYGQAAVTQMIVETLPAMAKNIAEPLGNIDKIKVWDGVGKEGSGAVRIAENVPSTLATVVDSVKEMTGFDIGTALENLTKAKKPE